MDKMRAEKLVILVDGIINLLLGLFLVCTPAGMMGLLNLNASSGPIYEVMKATLSVFGAVLFGIALALFLEYFGRPASLTGLGIGGAVSINLSGGLVLIGWLLWGQLNIPSVTTVLLWSLSLILILISILELYVHLKLTDSNISP